MSREESQPLREMLDSELAMGAVSLFVRWCLELGVLGYAHARLLHRAGCGANTCRACFSICHFGDGVDGSVKAWEIAATGGSFRP